MKILELKDFKAKIDKVVSDPSNQALATELLTQVYDAYESKYNEATTHQLSLSEKETQIGDLQKQNMNLFLKVGNPAPIAPDKINQAEPLKYDDVITSLGGK